jgi:UDP-N-acetyl-2-amino-2-deoxyglucuronate dehydrogenase
MLNFALVGCGRIAKRHSELLGGNQIKNARLVAVCDKIIDKAKIIANKYNVNAYSSMHQMMKNEKVDVVVILTESGLHAEHTIEIAKYKAHIIVEKPMALRLVDADSMINECEKFGVKLFVVKQNRFNVPVTHLKAALDEGRFGKIFLGTTRVRWSRDQDYYNQDSWRGTWEFDGGVLTNQASHHIDLLEWMMGDVDTVFAKGIQALANIETEDTAAVLINFKSGALGIIEATTAVRPKDLEGSLSILGENGSVEISGFAVNKMQHWNFIEKRPEDDEVISKFSVNPPNVYGFGHKQYYDHVIDCILNNKKQMVDGLEGKKSLALINAIYKSIELKQEIKFDINGKQSILGRKK